MDELPADFDIRLYPEYYLGLMQPVAFDAKTRQLFINSNREIMQRFNNATPSKRRVGKYRVYQIVYEKNAAIFVTPQSKSEHILFLDFGKTDEKIIDMILGGIK